MDTYERRSQFCVCSISVVITGLLFTTCVASLQFDSQPQFVQFPENKSTPIGQLLFTLRGTGSDSNEMTIYTMDPLTKLYVNITQEGKTSPITANITLNKLLDRESYESGLELKFVLNNTRGDMVTKSVRLYILDVCDQAPQFDRPSYTMEINEMNITNETLVSHEIHATDRDNGMNAVFTYDMEPKTNSGDYWRRIYNETFRIDPVSGGLYLRKSLDYEHNSLYQFTLHANDTCQLEAVPASLTIIVKDVLENHL